MTTKTCRVCTRTLDLSQFHVDRDGRPRSRCKQCMAADSASRRQQKACAPSCTPDPLNQALRQWRGPVGDGLLRHAA